MVLSDIVGVVEAKGTLALVVGDCSGNLEDVAVERSADVVQVGKDERLVEIKSTCNDVFGVFVRKFVYLIELELGLHQKLFVISQLNDQRAIEDLLQPGSESERNLVAHVHGAA